MSLRTREIAIRMGFGASAHDVLRLIVTGGLRLVGAGIAIGLFGAWALGRVIRGLLDDISPADPLVLGAVVALLAAVGMLACLAPARRAMRVEPAQALRVE